jgi:hypothetical protein
MLTSVFIAFSLAASLPGETEIARFKTAFEAGEAAFKKGEYGVAMALFDFADRQKATPEVAYDLAKCHEKISDVALSVYFYRLYLRRASAPTDAAEVNGRIQSILTQAATTQHGLFELDAPLASEIVVDGKRFPQGPVAIFLPAGQREVQLKFGAKSRDKNSRPWYLLSCRSTPSSPMRLFPNPKAIQKPTCGPPLTSRQVSAWLRWPLERCSVHSQHPKPSGSILIERFQ